MSLDEFYFGLNDCKVAAWSSAAVWGTAQDVLSIEMFGFNLQTVSGTAEGDDEITDAHARQISVACRMRFKFVYLEVLAILLGETMVDSTPTSKSMVFTPRNRPYFGLAGRVDGTSGGGDAQIFVPKVKVMGEFSLSMQYGQYVTPEVECLAINNGEPYYFGKLVKHATATSLTIPVV